MFRVASFNVFVILSALGVCSAQDLPEKKLDTAAFEQLLTVGWKYSPDNMATAISIYRDLKSANPDDLNLQHAMVLVAFRQQKYPEAKQLIRTSIEKYPQSIALRQTELWLLAVTKDYETALETVTQLAADFKNPARAKALSPLAGFCGQLIGCWQGPLKNQLPKTLTTARMTELEATIVKQWPPELAQAFVTENRATLEKYQQAKTQLTAKRVDVTAQQEQERVGKLETNKNEQADVQKQLTDLKAQADNSKADYEKLRDELALQLQTARIQYSNLQSQYNMALARALNLRADARSYRAKDRDPESKGPSSDRKARDADREAAKLESICRLLGQQAVPVKAQIARLANELSKRTAMFEKEYKNMDQAYRKLELTDKKLVNQKKVLEKPATGLNATTSKELDKLDNLDSYVPYSLEATKASLLKTMIK